MPLTTYSFVSAVHFELPHFAVEIAAMKSETRGGFGHVAAGPFDLLFDVLNLKVLGGVVERAFEIERT